MTRKAKTRAPAPARGSIKSPRRRAKVAEPKVAPTFDPAGGSSSLALVVRDSFTMPIADHALIGVLKGRSLGLGVAIKKSELLRAGLHVLMRISDEHLTQVLGAVESVKTGRPARTKKSKKAHRRSAKK